MVGFGTCFQFAVLTMQETTSLKDLLIMCVLHMSMTIAVNYHRKVTPQNPVCQWFKLNIHILDFACSPSGSRGTSLVSGTFIYMVPGQKIIWISSKYPLCGSHFLFHSVIPLIQCLVGEKWRGEKNYFKSLIQFNFLEERKDEQNFS